MTYIPGNKPYDTEPEIIPPKFNVEFESGALITEYDEGFIQIVLKYGQEGNFIEGFAGRYNISMDAFCEWLSKGSEYAEFQAAVKTSISACTHYWQQRLKFALENLQMETVPVLRAIVSDIQKTTPDALKQFLFNRLNTASAEEEAEAKKRKDQAEIRNSILGSNDE